MAAAPRINLAQSVADTLRDRILNGAFEVGGKLPSEATLRAEFGVSRTVVREAIATLRADGLVEARQGAGVFVLRQSTPMSGLLQSVNLDKISSVIEVLELRIALETEAARLAATRRSPAQNQLIQEACDDLITAITQGTNTTEADMAFHLAVARATNNPRFVDFLEMLGDGVIPRRKVSNTNTDPARPAYLHQIAQEHQAIATAISAQNPDAAAEAMRSHLSGAKNRYHQLV